MSALRKRPSAKHFGKATLKPKRAAPKTQKAKKAMAAGKGAQKPLAANKPKPVVRKAEKPKRPTALGDKKKNIPVPTRPKPVVKNAGKASKAAAVGKEAQKTLATRRPKSVVKKAERSKKTPELSDKKKKKILVFNKPKPVVKNARKTKRAVAVGKEVKKPLAANRPRPVVRKAKKPKKPAALGKKKIRATSRLRPVARNVRKAKRAAVIGNEVKKFLAANRLRREVRKAERPKRYAAPYNQANETVIFNGQPGQTVTVTVTVTTMGGTYGRSLPGHAPQIEKSVVFESPSAKAPGPGAQPEKSVHRDARANPPAGLDGGAGQSGVVDRQAEKAPEPEPKAGNAVNLDVPGGPSGGAEQRRKKKVLLIEDDKTMLKLLEMGLRTHDYDCLIAENGRAAQVLLQTNRPDVILVDLLMPVMDGVAFIQWLRQTARDSTPVLVFSTVDNPKIMQEVLKSGADFFARKPLHLKELVETMDKLAGLGHHREPKPASA